jgi:hypothetical protein
MSVDTSHYGADNGHGGRTYDSIATIQAKAKLERDAEVKAAADPSSLDDTDLRHLSAETLSRLLDRGDLIHLGVGRRRTGRRR